jgi:diaminohydroxyphosphoribosylaminopyrimidine deaminase/5-amino-6-(5-phosphoribosylamino)uracil reductase
MQRALYLAQKGRFSTSPNPRVGAVIVHKGQIIGEGYHRKYGEAHAEPNAIASVKDKSLLPESTLYVTLEPCSHHGKTPPCVDLVLEHQIPEVFIATKDPFEKVDGSGIERLKAAGLKVEIGLLEDKARQVNKRFFCFHQKKRPFITLKWAEAADGFIGRDQNDPNKMDSWITTGESKQLVHLWRAEESGILVGKNTALIDNPSLTCRLVQGDNPSRLLIDEQLEVPKDYHIFNKEASTLVFNAQKDGVNNQVEYIQLDFSNSTNLIDQMLEKLYKKDIQSILIEGGKQTLQHFIDANLWDEAHVFVGKKKFSKGVKAPTFEAPLQYSEKISGDRLNHYQNE